MSITEEYEGYGVIHKETNCETCEVIYETQ